MPSSTIKRQLNSNAPSGQKYGAVEERKSKADASRVLEYTNVEEIPLLVSKLHKSFHNQRKTHPLQFRLNQLRNIYFAIKDNIDDLCDALYKDFGRSPYETKNLEYTSFMAELVFMMSNLHKWMKPEDVKDVPITMKANPIYIERIPLGTVLVITPFNYPLVLSLSSLIGAISGGNNVVMKLSESTPHFSQLLTNLLTDALDPDTFAIVNGGVPETSVLLDQKFDKIIYTGSGSVGKIVAKKAAEHLTPVILELGGKSPAFVLEDVTDGDIETIARRIAWGRFTNSGQTCVAIDYVLAHEKVKAKLVKALAKIVEESFYKNTDADDRSYTHIIHSRAFGSHNKVISSTKGTIVTGGQSDEKSRFIYPTVVDNVDWDDSTMSDEIFGPVLPVLSYSDLDSAIQKVVENHDTPLAMYVFTSGSTSRAKNPQLDSIRSRIRSGGTMVNDSILHVALYNAPFGGIGESGVGAYHGFYSFKAFTHERTTIESNLKAEFAMKVRYPPFDEKKSNVIQASALPYNDKVWFGRNGNVAPGGPNAGWSAWNSITGLCSLVYHFAKA